MGAISGSGDTAPGTPPDSAADPTRGGAVWVIYDAEHGAFLRVDEAGAVRWTSLRMLATEWPDPAHADDLRRNLRSGSTLVSVQRTTPYPR